ncbi:unnamed protein product [Bursaphelenchus xylophilus]|uniref:(pine wood nematode) hypothetical protein n=1 Tax=Bursaphelenchus xylophilus TaxID=6326 RepID=A0A811KWB2_BURXY|nr:unnamed protein product [Bursaphelenchus xylophilus]CAG9105030.1 unnamed protein product [Bursaphelenchus xylophilus]
MPPHGALAVSRGPDDNHTIRREARVQVIYWVKSDPYIGKSNVGNKKLHSPKSSEQDDDLSAQPRNSKTHWRKVDIDVSYQPANAKRPGANGRVNRPTQSQSHASLDSADLKRRTESRKSMPGCQLSQKYNNSDSTGNSDIGVKKEDRERAHKGGIVNCIKKDLTRIPDGIPENTVRLDLQENQISKIGKKDLAKLTHLKILQLQDNKLATIESGAFDELRNLERLRLNRNLLQTIPEKLFEQNPKLHRLDLSENQLAVITDDHLIGPKSMRNLQLDKNRLTCLDTQLISSWNEMEILTLNGNSLNTMGEIAVNPNLRVFRLFDNPWHCDCRLKWLKHVSTATELLSNVKCHRPAMLQGRNIASVDIQYMKCSGIEKRAASSCQEARVCPAVCTCTDTTVDCRDRGLKYIPMNLPTSTTELRLEQNHITQIPKDVFKPMKNLRRLDLSKNNIHTVDPEAFSGLSSLNTLVLYANNITDLPEGVFDPLVELQLLLLNANKLQCLRKDLFKKQGMLNLLSLYDNEIKSIANGTFQPLKMLQTLHLARNPLICDCNLEWLAEYLHHHPIETSGAKCEGPKRMAKKKLGSVAASSFRCKGSEIFVTKSAGEYFIDNACPAGCFCHHTVVDCSGRELDQVPEELPHFTTELRLNKNNLKEIKVSDGFGGLKNLRKLDLGQNQIKNIENGALDGMQNLKELNLSSNHIRHFSTKALGKTANFLEILDISDNRLMCVTQPTFGGFRKLQFLSLAKNDLRCVTEHAFNNLTEIKNLYLSNNELQCDCHLKSFVEDLQRNLSSKIFDSPVCAGPKELAGKEILSLKSSQLICDGDSFSICAEDGNYCPAGCLCENKTVRCSGRGFKEFPLGIPSDTTELYLDNNEISAISAKHFGRLPNLLKLDLSQNHLKIIESDVFSAQSQLHTLILAYNELQCIEERAFQGLSSLKILSLHGNRIAILPENAFSDLHFNLSHIAVGANQLHCDCRLKWFSHWIKERFVEPGIARCESPKHLRNKLLLTSDESRFECGKEKDNEVEAKCDACAVNPCRNHGVCTRQPSLSFKCVCSAGFHGSLCEHEIDACYGDPCHHNGTCKVIEEGRFKCYCPKGFRGERCEINIDDCANNKCQNGAKCLDMINGYKCECPPMFSGKFCEKKLVYCTKDMNPCKNNGKCLPVNGGANYSCLCQTGFTGENCTINADDCHSHQCQNGGLCVDGLGKYECNCPIGYSGQHCELMTSMANLLYNDNPPSCSPHTCLHGQCVANEEDELECKCEHGYSGKDCDKRQTIGFDKKDSYVALPPWETSPEGNLSFVVRTEKSDGVIAYYGDGKAHLALELFDGRVKVSFYVGNYPASHLYSYAIINDGAPHRMKVSVSGNKVGLTIDNLSTQTVVNFGKIEMFELSTKQFLFLGGLPETVGKRAVNGFHIKTAESMKGCITNITVNNKTIDLNEDVVDEKNIIAGCVGVVNVCNGVRCQNNGKCLQNSTNSNGFSCECSDGFSGDKCEKREIRCIKEKFREYVEEGQCRSVEKIKNARCLGWCGNADANSLNQPMAGCCAAVRIKKRKVRLQCLDGTERTKTVDIIRKCQCSNDCQAPKSPFVI